MPTDPLLPEPDPTPSVDAADASADGADPTEAPRRGFSVWWVLGPILFLVAVGSVTASFVPAPYILFAPGSARNTEPLVSVPKAKSHHDKGEVLFLTVSVVRPTYMQAIWGWLQPDIDVYPYKAIYGDQTNDQNRAESRADMNQSKLVAAKVALQQLGYPVEVHGTGVLLQAVDPGFPVAKVAAAGDVVVATDGSPTTTDEALVAAIAKHHAGDPITLTLERKDTKGRTTVRTTLGRREGTKDTAVLGVQIQTRDLDFKLPFTVGIDSGEVGGPSAGLAFTLATLDRLTPGSITGGHKVAVTGAMSADGRVLEVGGVRQKAVAARRQGAELFLVPTGEYEDALQTAGGMRVVKVDTLAEALQALAKIGGNALDLGKPGAGA